MSAREFFETVRSAAMDITRCHSMLESMERRAYGMGSPSFEVRVRGNGTDAMGSRVAALVDRETELHERIERDYAMIDLAHAILYGDGMSDGLASLAPSWWADVLSLHYCELMTWADVGKTLCYSESHVKQRAYAAFDVLDAHGLADSVAGRGFAQDA